MKRHPEKDAIFTRVALSGRKYSLYCAEAHRDPTRQHSGETASPLCALNRLPAVKTAFELTVCRRSRQTGNRAVAETPSRQHREIPSRNSRLVERKIDTILKLIHSERTQSVGSEAKSTMHALLPSFIPALVGGLRNANPACQFHWLVLIHS